jgi:transketolase
MKWFKGEGLKATRHGFGDALVELGKINPDVWVLGADLTESVRVHSFKKEFPNRYLSCGIAEQNMLGIALGLALSGKIPFATTFSMFAANRGYDAWRTIAQEGANVKVGASHAGLSVGADGATHQALEDIGSNRVLPGVTVLVPCDYVETKQATLTAADFVGPVYIRFGREVVPIITAENAKFEIGKAKVMYEPSNPELTIVACGLMVAEALDAAEILNNEGIEALVINVHTIKPLDDNTILEAAKLTGAFVTAEEHQLASGMGSAVAELIAEHYPIPIEMVGVRDSFGQSGNPRVILEQFHMDTPAIVSAAKRVLKRK